MRFMYLSHIVNSLMHVDPYVDVSSGVRGSSSIRGGSRIFGKGVQMYNGAGVRCADFISFF